MCLFRSTLWSSLAIFEAHALLPGKNQRMWDFVGQEVDCCATFLKVYELDTVHSENEF